MTEEWGGLETAEFIDERGIYYFKELAGTEQIENFNGSAELDLSSEGQIALTGNADEKKRVKIRPDKSGRMDLQRYMKRHNEYEVLPLPSNVIQDAASNESSL